jgi:hypothetical protein
MGIVVAIASCSKQRQRPEQVVTSQKTQTHPIYLFGDRRNRPVRRTVDLSEIWSVQLRGTRDLWSLEKSVIQTDPDIDWGIDGDLLPRDVYLTSRRGWSSGIKTLASTKIGQILAELSAEKAAGPSFIVSGHGEEALRNAHAIIVDGQTASNTITTGSQGSVVFFTISTIPVEITDCIYNAREVRIRYRFLPVSKESIAPSLPFPTLALIPIYTDMSPSIASVEIERVPCINMEDEKRRQPFLRVVCKSCVFSIDRQE